MSSKGANYLLEVRNLETQFQTPGGLVKAVRGVSFGLGYGESCGLIGESGCGKTVTSLSILGLVPPPYGKIVNGEIYFKGDDLLQKSEEKMRKIRGREIGMIFQDPTSSLNPVLSIGTQLGETIETHLQYQKPDVRGKIISLLEKVGIRPPSERLRNYPHQLSGGMRQRVMIAMSLSCEPSLIIADEPTTNLDVTIQAQILRLLKGLKEEFNTSLLYITHNLGVVAKMCQQVNVMYAGKIVESADVKTVFKEPKHPYTLGLLKSIPRLGRREKLAPIPGLPPNMIEIPSGCSYHPRCPYAMETCRTKEPALKEVNSGHLVACWLY